VAFFFKIQIWLWPEFVLLKNLVFFLMLILFVEKSEIIWSKTKVELNEPFARRKSSMVSRHLLLSKLFEDEFLSISLKEKIKMCGV